MRVIITGGTGLIGTELAKSLVQDGCEVIVLSRNPEKNQADLPPGVQALAWDRHTAVGWGQAADGADAIVNLAGDNLSSGRWTEKKKRLILDSRVSAGQAVTQAVQQAAVKPEVVIQSSGVDYYGVRQIDKNITEKSPPGSGFLSDVCVQWEDSTKPVEALGVRRAVIRSGVVLTPKGGALPRLALPFKLFAGGRLGSGQQWFPWIHMADEVAAIRFLLQNPKASGPFNLAAPNPLTNARFSRILGRVLNRPALFPVPAFALKLLLGEMSTIVLGGQKAVPRRLQDLGFQFKFPEAEPALRDLYGK